MEWFERAIRVHKMTPLTFVCYTMRDPKKKSKKFDQIAILFGRTLLAQSITWMVFCRRYKHYDDGRGRRRRLIKRPSPI